MSETGATGRIWLPELLWADDEMKRGWALAIDGERIAAVGPADAVIRDHPEWPLEPMPGKLLLPGCVNGHNHSFQILMRGLGEDDSFFGWRSRVLYPLSERLTVDELRGAAELAFADMLRHGITTVADFFYLNDGGTANALAVAEAATRVGIRLCLARTFYDWAGAPARYRESPAGAVAETRALARALKGQPLVTVQVAPHSPHGASAAMMGAAVELAAELNVKLHVHVAEGQYERQQVLEREGVSPIKWLDQLGALSPQSVLIHAVWVDEEDLDRVAERQASVIHNPASNMILGDGIAPVPAMLQRGITVGLGTDGGCTNDRHSIFDDMRMAALLQKVAALNGEAMDAGTVFRMGTSGGADALGLPAGRLAPGCLADVVAIALDDVSLLPGPVTVRHIVYAMSATAVDSVWVGGRRVVAAGRPQQLASERVAWARGWQDASGASSRVQSGTAAAAPG